MIPELIKKLKEEFPEATEERDFDLSKDWEIEDDVEIIPIDRLQEGRGRTSKDFKPENAAPVIDSESILEEDHEIEEEIKEKGLEVIARYYPYHLYKKWGIYLQWRGILSIAQDLHRQNPKESINTYIEDVWRLLYCYAFFCFITEWGASFTELVFLKLMGEKKPLYVPFFDWDYNEKKELEKALATVYSLNKFNKSLRKKIEKLFLHLPTEYRNFKNFKGLQKFTFGKRKLGRFITLPALLLDSKSKPVSKKLRGLEKLTRNSLSEEPPYELLLSTDIKYSYLFISEIPCYLVKELSHSSSKLRFMTVFRGAKVAAYPSKESYHEPHIHVRIPPQSRIEKKYRYPNLEPLGSSPSLSNKERKKVEAIIKIYKPKFDKILTRE